MALSKSQRFDIFRRDGFTCGYCGRRPPDVVLEVDHVQPRSKGGSDDSLNLITACFDCNRGKSATVLTDAVPKPDADLEFLAIQQELAELQRYVEARALREKGQEEVIQLLADTWFTYLNKMWCPPDNVFQRWLREYSAEEIEAAIVKAHLPFRAGRITGGVQGVMGYVKGIMRRTRDGD